MIRCSNIYHVPLPENSDDYVKILGLDESRQPIIKAFVHIRATGLFYTFKSPTKDFHIYHKGRIDLSVNN